MSVQSTIFVPVQSDNELFVRTLAPTSGPTEGLLAIELNYAAEDLGATFQECAERASRFSLSSRQAVRLVLYLLLLAAVITFTITFVFVKIIPTFQVIFMDFGMELPRVTLFVISVGDLTSGWDADGALDDAAKNVAQVGTAEELALKTKTVGHGHLRVDIE